MRAVIQRVKYAKVKVEEKIVGQIQTGFLILLGITHNDNDKEIKWMSNKIAGLRIFTDEFGKMNLSLDEVNGEILLISQFTLYGDCTKGRRPSFVNAEKGHIAEEIYLKVGKELETLGIKVEKGIFGADMAVELLNDGPVTIILDTADAKHLNN